METSQRCSRRSTRRIPDDQTSGTELATSAGMKNHDWDTGPREDPQHNLETAFILEYLQAHGHDLASARGLPLVDAHRLFTAASTYASGRLMEVESRAHYVHELHGEH